MGNRIRIKQIDLQGIFSASNQVDILSASNYAQFVTQLDTTMSSDAELAAVSSSISESIYTINQVIGSGLISGSSQLTSSYDTRYILSGSITQTTWDNIDGKPSGLVSQSTDLSSLNHFTQSIDSRVDNLENLTGSYATTGSNVFKGNQTISGSVSILIPGGTATGLNENSTPNNIFWSNEPSVRDVQVGWTAEIQGGGTYTVTDVQLDVPFAPFVAVTLSDVSLALGYRVRINFSKNSKLWQFNNDGTLTGLPDGIISGSSQIANLGFVTGSFTTINTFNNLTQSFNSISQSFTTISSSVGGVDFAGINAVTESYLQFTQSYQTDSSSFDGRITTEKERIDAILSASSADKDSFAEIVSLINSVDLTNDNAFATFYTSSNARISSLENATGSYLTSLSGAISSSSQLTSSFDTRYTLSGSVQPLPSGLISGSSQLTSSFDERYTLSGSVVNSNINTGSFATTGSNIFSGSQVFSGSMTVTSGQIIASTITNNSSSLYLQSGSNLYVQNNGIVEITGSIILNGTTYTSLTGSVTIPVGTISGSSQLTSSFDTRYTLSGSVQPLPSNLVSSSAQITAFGFISSSQTIDTGSFLTTSSYQTDSASFDTRINSIITESGSNLTYFIEAYANDTYTLPGTFTEDICRYSVVSATENVPSSWFDTSTYTFTPQKAGYWEIIASYDVYRNSEASLIIKKNNNTIATAGSFNAVAQDISKIVYLNGSTDYITIFNTGLGSVQRNQFQSRSWFQAKFVGNINGSTELPAGLVSGSSQLTSSFDTRYLNTNGDGVISGSSQLTSSFDTRYILSGSSVSINTGSFATTGSNVFIGTETISGSLLLSGSFSYNGTPLQNGFAFAQPQLTRILDNASYTGASAWTTSYTGSGGAIIVTANMSGYRSSIGSGTAQLLRDGVAVASQTFFFNIANYHTAITPLVYVSNSETGSHTYSIYYNGILVDTQDYATINVLEYGNSAILPATLISGSSQLTSSFDTRYEGVGRGVVSGSSQLTASYDTRYTLSGSVVSGTTPAGTVSGSSQLTSSFDGRYVQTGSFNSLTASFNSFTASAQSVTTGSNSFNGTQIITGSLIITTGSFIGSQITANTSSLYLTSGSNMYVQNNGVVEITGSLKVNGTTRFETVGGDEGGEIEFGLPQTNTSLSTRVVQDIFQNRLRIFDGNTNGVFIDLSKAPTGVAGEITWKSSGIVNAGTFVQLDNIKATVTSSGQRGLSLATVSGTFTYNIGGTYGGVSVGSGGSGAAAATLTTTPTTSIFGWGFPTQGDTSTYILTDITNYRVYRITLQIGNGYNNNFISIERLH